VARYTQVGARTYLTDALGSVLAVAKDDQSIQAFYAYTPYGETQVLGDDEGNPIQYTARENDQTSLYFYRARYYDPVLKRFISEDPIGFRGGANVYAYVRGNPMIFSDPLGLVNAVRGGVVLRAGYQVPGNPSAGLGWRVTIVARYGLANSWRHTDLAVR
jgi:RHS repeat-associated protein